MTLLMRRSGGDGAALILVGCPRFSGNHPLSWRRVGSIPPSLVVAISTLVEVEEFAAMLFLLLLAV
jgi:hypothetical protein